MRSSLKKLLALMVFIVVLVASISILNLRFPSYDFAFRYVYAAIILGGGVLLSRELSSITARELKPRLHNAALSVSNVVAISGYIVSALVAASYASFSPTDVLATAAASGLVLGLALQPTLGSFFAGILILVSGEIRPGNQVRILSWHIPFQGAFTPGYKYFSPDQIYAGYMAEVIEIGLFFTTVLTEEGQTMKFPNTIIATDAAIVTYTGRDYIFNVRYEFPNRFDPGLVLKRVKEETKDFPVLNVYVNEQSDKEYYIVKVVLNAREQDHAQLKSEILTRFIRLHGELGDAEKVVVEK
jgi:small-conductance mechanosensitive channel